MILEKSSFCCPVCGAPLFRLEKVLRCMQGHSFDIARQGYVNLLLRGGSGHHGDDKLMVAARSAFLSRGYYEPLRSALADIVGQGHTLLDSGCGEGYYTSVFCGANRVLGIDISKDALAVAARRCKEAEFAVASSARLPLRDGAVDTVLCIFAPESREEFVRVLSCGGRLITVTPCERHLWELKAAVYDTPYENPPPTPVLEGFRVLHTKELKYEITLNGKEDIEALFKMTPYYYKTSVADQAKLESLESLTTRLEFFIKVYEKE